MPNIYPLEKQEQKRGLRANHTILGSFRIIVQLLSKNFVIVYFEFLMKIHKNQVDYHLVFVCPNKQSV